MKAASLIKYLDDLLDVPNYPDYSGAFNGLQVEIPDDVRHVATAVDASAATALAAKKAHADLLIVHHGMLWGGVRRVTGDYYLMLRELIAARCGLYSVHLPLDGHPNLGNNAILAKKLGLKRPQPFGNFKGNFVGRIGGAAVTDVAVASERLGIRVIEAVAPARPIRRMAIVSGGAGSLLREAADAGADALLTGEVDHHVRVAARDLGLGIWLGGHYATETFGVRALGEHLADKHGLKHSFLDLPTGG